MIFELKLSMILYDNKLVHEMLITLMFYYFIIAIIISELKFNMILYDNVLVHQVLMIMMFYYFIILNIYSD